VGVVIVIVPVLVLQLGCCETLPVGVAGCKGIGFTTKVSMGETQPVLMSDAST